MENLLQPAAAGETDVGAFTAELDALTRRHGIQNFASYGVSPCGEVIVSYVNENALVRAHSAFHEKYISILNTVTSQTPLHQ
ncbi:hypothetical protein [Spirosoma arcticum]